MRICRIAAPLLVLMPALARASDPTPLIPFIVAGVALVGGVVAGFEWMIINALTDRGKNAAPSDPESQNKSRFGCSLGIALWVANSVIAWFVLFSLDW